MKSLFFIKAVLLFAVFSLVVCCNKDKDEEIPQLSITGFTPTTAFEGEAVTIRGISFSTATAGNLVDFNGTRATVTSATSTELQVTVPAGAATGKITVQVNGTTATSASVFTVRQTTVGTFSPTSGLPGTTVKIAGTDFDTEPSGNTVKFNGTLAEVTSASSQELTVVVPEGATTGKITVIAHDKTITSATDFTVLELSVTSFNPTSAKVGTEVVITGNNFSAEANGNIVMFGEAVADIVSASSTQITVVVPQDAETGPISVTTAGNSSSSSDPFTVLEPVITNFSPLIGTTGYEVTIVGENFSSNASELTVSIGDLEAEILSASETELLVRMPSGHSGKIKVALNTRAGESAETFTYHVPEVSVVFPDISAPGIEITLTGNYFSPLIEYNTITFGGVEGEVTSASTTELKVIVPDGAVNGQFRFDNDSGTSGFNFTVCGNGTELVPFDPVISDVSGDGETFRLQYKILNAGNESADLGNVTVIGIVSDDDVIESADPDFTDVPLSGTVESGAVYDVDVMITLPSGISIDDHPNVRFTTYITPATLEECSQDNNVLGLIYP